MNGRLELRRITQAYSEVYWGYFGRLVFGNSLTKQCYQQIVIFRSDLFPLAFPHTALTCYHANPPDSPRRIGLHERDRSSHHTHTSWVFAKYRISRMIVCGTLKCENAAICEKIAKC